jgi:hypothetical protein
MIARIRRIEGEVDVTRHVRVVLGVVVAICCTLVAGTALAIGNGVPDGNGHPNVGLLAIDIEVDGVPKRVVDCSGSYAGPRKGGAGSVFLTAGHCVAFMPGEGITGSQLWVTFDTNATFDPETGEVLGATTWHHATAFAFDPAFGHDTGNLKDYAVVLLESTIPGLTPVQLPTAGLLDGMAAIGGLKPGVPFDNVGYGVVPSPPGGPPSFAPPPGRMFSTSLFKGLTKSWLKLQMNPNAGEDNGGSCFGDSGSPKFVHGTNTVVAVTTGGDRVCRAESINQRLDVTDARAFLGQYLNLP